MMKNFKSMLSIAASACALAVMLTACGSSSDDNDEPQPPVNNDGSNSVEFIPSLQELARNTDTQFENGDDISVWAVETYTSTPGRLKTSGNYADNVRYTYNGSRFVSATTTNVIEKSDDVKLNYYAVYPYSTSNGPKFKFDVLTDQSVRSNYTASDLCVAFTGVLTSPTVDLPFSHVMGQLVINVSSSFGTVTGVELQNFIITANVDLNEAIIETNTTTSNRANVIMGSNGARSFRAVLPVQQVYSGYLAAVVHTTSGDYTWTVDRQFNLNSGKSVSFDLYPNEDASAVSFGGSIAPWIVD